MKQILLLAILLLPLSALAAGLEVPEKKKDDPGSPTNKADQYEATKKNDDLYKGEIKDAQFGIKVFDDATGKVQSGATPELREALKQNDALVIHENVLTSCVETALNGRSDELCKENPSHPECVGMNATMTNALCNSPGYVPKDENECKQANKDYTPDEWMAFGSQYFTGMQHCGDAKMRTSGPGTMVSLTDMLTTPKASGTSTLGVVPTSGISGAVPATKDGTTVKVSATLASLNIPDDGSSRLGYENGEILKRAEKGDMFYAVVMESPVVEDMKPKNRAGIERGLLEPNLVLDKARMAGRLPALGENLEQYAAATDPNNIPPPPSDGLDDLSDLLGTTAKPAKAGSGASQMGSTAKPAPEAPSPLAVNEEAKVASGDAAIGRVKQENAVLAAATASSVSATALTPVADLLKPEDAKAGGKPARQLMLHERIAMIEAAARAAQAAKEAGRAPASIPALADHSRAQAAPADLETVSLFQRISSAYRKKIPLLRTVESAAGRDLRSADAPKFFKEL